MNRRYKEINAQNDDEFYKENSMYIIYNNGDIAQLESDVDRVI